MTLFAEWRHGRRLRGLKAVVLRVRSTRTIHRYRLPQMLKGGDVKISLELQLLFVERHDCPFAKAQPQRLPLVPGQTEELTFEGHLATRYCVDILMIFGLRLFREKQIVILKGTSTTAHSPH